METQGKVKWEPKIISAADLENMEIPDPEWIVDEILPTGLSIFSGQPKAGKSWLVLDLAHSVATGNEFLGVIPVCKVKVLYIALEDSLARTVSRLISIDNENPFPDDLLLSYEWKSDIQRQCVPGA